MFFELSRLYSLYQASLASLLAPIFIYHYKLSAVAEVKVVPHHMFWVILF